MANTMSPRPRLTAYGSLGAKRVVGQGSAGCDHVPGIVQERNFRIGTTLEQILSVDPHCRKPLKMADVGYRWRHSREKAIDEGFERGHATLDV
jgi:hypothetical protein